jgi:hypothetical protein
LGEHTGDGSADGVSAVEYGNDNGDSRQALEPISMT